MVIPLLLAMSPEDQTILHHVLSQPKIQMLVLHPSVVSSYLSKVPLNEGQVGSMTPLGSSTI